MISASVALVGAFIYGAADFFGGLAARRLRAIVVTAFSAATGLAFLLLLSPLFGTHWDARDAVWGAIAGIFGVVAIALLYACLAIGPMSILSPLTAVTSAIAPTVWGLTVGAETLSPLALVGLGVALVAVVLVGFVPESGAVRPSARGILMAIGSGLAIGALLIALDQAGPDSGLTPLIANRTVNLAITGTIVCVLIIVGVRRGRGAASALRPTEARLSEAAAGNADREQARIIPGQPSSTTDTLRRSVLLAIGCGVLDAAANTMLLFALRTGDLSVVAALTALYPAGTIVLARLVLRERVAPVQGVGLLLALAAGALLAIG